MEQEIITSAEAARIFGVSRQRIHQIRKVGKLSTPINSIGKPMRGKVYKMEVETLCNGERGTGGRPKTRPDNLNGFRVGDIVDWFYVPSKGFGYSIEINATVAKLGASKLQLEFQNKEGKTCTAWVKPDDSIIKWNGAK